MPVIRKPFHLEQNAINEDEFKKSWTQDVLAFLQTKVQVVDAHSLAAPRTSYGRDSSVALLGWPKKIPFWISDEINANKSFS